MKHKPIGTRDFFVSYLAQNSDRTYDMVIHHHHSGHALFARLYGAWVRSASREQYDLES